STTGVIGEDAVQAFLPFDTPARLAGAALAGAGEAVGADRTSERGDGVAQAAGRKRETFAAEELFVPLVGAAAVHQVVVRERPVGFVQAVEEAAAGRVGHVGGANLPRQALGRLGRQGLEAPRRAVRWQ